VTITEANASEPAQVVWTEEELLTSHPYAEPLVAAGVRCHGGFDDQGTYVSPRTLHRGPAIRAWQAKHQREVGAPLLGLPLDTWPEQYPNVVQARSLIEAGAPEPIIASLTRIGTVEGFGSMIRHSVLPDFNRLFSEGVDGTATDHLDRGLYEAHARDEAGHEEEAGHKQMWFAARDIAFENPVTEDETVLMLERMGIATPGTGGQIDPERLRARALAGRILPDDIPFEFEAVLDRMTRLLLIEISAFHTFAWAEELLSDPNLVAGDGEAARLVSYICADETPHVEYLRTVLSEMKARTVVGAGGRRHAGADLVGRIWDRALDQSLGVRRQDGLETTRREVIHALSGRSDAADVLARFDQLGTVHRREDGTWIEAADGAATAD
jgi:hypothetical protein